MLFSIALYSMITLASAAEAEVAPPPVDASAQQKASFEVKLEVNEKGAADKCEVIKTDAPPELSEKVCPVFLEKARFTPAVDQDGKPKRVTMTQKVTFVLNN